MYEVFVVYEGFSRVVDERLFKIAGRRSDGSGCFIRGPHLGVRDHVWYFSAFQPAVRVYRRLVAVGAVGDQKFKTKLSGPIPAKFLA